MELYKELQMNNLPILIPIKKLSERCPGKNKALLPFTAYYLKQQKLIQNAIVISDSIELLNFAKSIGFISTFLEHRKSTQDELTSCHNFIKTTAFYEFILLPVTHPFRDRDLIYKSYSLYVQEKENIDFITSFTEINNREHFYLELRNNNPFFLKTQTRRRGNLCKNIPMIDGSIYLIKSNFIQQVACSEDSNATFWKGRFKCVKKNTPFMDIDTISDLNNFNFLKNFFSKLNNQK